MQDKFGKIDERFDRQDVKFENMMSILDGHAKKVDDYAQEMSMLNNQVNRHDKWINKIAINTCTKLGY